MYIYIKKILLLIVVTISLSHQSMAAGKASNISEEEMHSALNKHIYMTEIRAVDPFNMHYDTIPFSISDDYKPLPHEWNTRLYPAGITLSSNYGNTALYIRGIINSDSNKGLAFEVGKDGVYQGRFYVQESLRSTKLNIVVSFTETLLKKEVNTISRAINILIEKYRTHPDLKGNFDYFEFKNRKPCLTGDGKGGYKELFILKENGFTEVSLYPTDPHMVNLRLEY